MLRNYGLYVALRIASLVIPALPLRVAYALACSAGNCGYYLFAGQRSAIRQNLSQVTGEPAGSPRVRGLARRAFQHDAKNWVDTLRIAALSNDEILAAVDVQGWEHVERALQSGKGLILITMHLGNFDLVGQVLAARGLKVTVPVERMKPDRLFRFLTEGRRSKGINAVPFDRAARAMLQALQAGEIVGIAGDRQAAGRSVPVTFFGREALLPRSPFSLARHTGAPVVVGLGVRLANDRFQGIATPVVDFARSGDADRDDRANARCTVRLMEGFIAQYPDQWLVFSPIWTDENRRNTAATMEHQSHAAV